MKIEYQKTKYDKTPATSSEVEGDTPLKRLIVDYVGNKLNPEKDEITVESIVEVFADEFPEFVLALAEENWIRGYNQGIADTAAMQED